MTALWIGLGVVAFGLLARRRLFELWEDVQVARRQVDLQRLRRAELAPKLADALGERLDAETAAALRGDDEAARSAALAALPPPTESEDPTLASMRADLEAIEFRLAARLNVLAAESARYRFLAPTALNWLVRAPSHKALPPVPEDAVQAARALDRGRARVYRAVPADPER